MGLYRDGVLGQPDEIERVDPSAGPEQGWAVGIWSNNRPGPSPLPPFPSLSCARARLTKGRSGGRRGDGKTEWQMVDMATQAFGLVSTALYDTLGPTTTGPFFPAPSFLCPRS